MSKIPNVHRSHNADIKTTGNRSNLNCMILIVLAVSVYIVVVISSRLLND